VLKETGHLPRMARSVGVLIAFVLLLSLLLPVAGTAQEANEDATTEALVGVPTTGAGRRGPILPASALARAPESESERVAEEITPVEFQIDAFGIAAPVEIGTIVDGAMQDPTGPWVVAWYEPLGKIAEDNNVVMAGHVDYWNTGPNGTAGPAIFWEVPNLASGDIIRLLGENGETYEYAVEWTKLYDVATELTPEVIQTEIVGDTDQESLTLITCGGPFDPVTGEYLQRWIVRANMI